MTLAAIIEEGRAMNAPNWTGPRGYRDVWWAEHGPALLAVAKAGRTLAAAVAGTGSCAEELAAFDAAVRGEGKEKEG